MTGEMMGKNIQLYCCIDDVDLMRDLQGTFGTYIMSLPVGVDYYEH